MGELRRGLVAVLAAAGVAVLAGGLRGASGPLATAGGLVLRGSPGESAGA